MPFHSCGTAGFAEAGWPWGACLAHHAHPGKLTLLLADEPTGALDTKTSVEIMALFEALYQKGNTIIIVTHEEDIARHAHRIVKLRDGKIIHDEPNEPITTEQHLAHLSL